MTTYRNTNWTRRDYEATNVVACTAPAAPSENWKECPAKILHGLDLLWREGEVRFYGYL